MEAMIRKKKRLRRPKEGGIRTRSGGERQLILDLDASERLEFSS